MGQLWRKYVSIKIATNQLLMGKTDFCSSRNNLKASNSKHDISNRIEDTPQIESWKLSDMIQNQN